MITFHTQSASVYEVDPDKKLIRRVMSENYDKGRRLGKGEWRQYKAISPIESGLPVFVEWPSDTPPLDPNEKGSYIPATITSRVVEVFNSEETH